jgi:hypothetical protein
MKRRRWTAVMILSAVVIGCGDGQGPRAGELSVQLQGPSADDRAIMFDLTGPVQTISPASQTLSAMVDTLAADSVRIAIFAPRGSSITAGAIARIHVENVCDVARYHAGIVEVAGSDYSLRSPAGYGLSVRAADSGC